MNILCGMSRVSYLTVVDRNRTLGEMIQAQVPRLETNELLAQASANMLNQIQPTVADILGRLAIVEAAMGRGIMAGTDRPRHSRDVTESKPVNSLAIFSEKRHSLFVTGQQNLQR